jgi:hypothetical protein
LRYLFSKTRGIEGVLSAEMSKKLCNAGFSVTPLDDLNVLYMTSCLLTAWDPIMEYHAGYPGTAGRNREEMGASVNIFSILIACLVESAGHSYSALYSGLGDRRHNN